MFNVQRSSKSAAYFWNFVNMRTQPTFSISSKSKCNCKFSYDNSHFEMRFYFNEFCQNWVSSNLWSSWKLKYRGWNKILSKGNSNTYSCLETSCFKTRHFENLCFTCSELWKLHWTHLWQNLNTFKVHKIVKSLLILICEIK